MNSMMCRSRLYAARVSLPRCLHSLCQLAQRPTAIETAREAAVAAATHSASDVEYPG
jgi:hypothetical protein